MTDVWSTVDTLDLVTQDRLAEVLETRAADPRQRAMRMAFLSEVVFPDEAQVLEVGCGTGALTRLIATWPNVATVVAVDPARSLLDKARDLSQTLSNISYQVADGRTLPFDDACFDVVVFDSTLCHVPEPERALAEAHRVLRRGGLLAAFDGDYATATVAIGDHDPLENCVEVMIRNSVHDRMLVRKLPMLARIAGFDVLSTGSHGYVESDHPDYMLTVIDRGADMLLASGIVGADAAEALKAEARRRAERGTFFGHVAYGSMLAKKAMK